MSASSDEQDKDIPLSKEPIHEQNGTADETKNGKRNRRNRNAKVAPSDSEPSPDNESSSDEEYQFKEEDQVDAISNSNTGTHQRHQTKTYDSDSDRRVSTDSIEIHDDKPSLSPKEVNIEVQTRAQIKEAWPKQQNKKVWFSSLEFQNLAVSLKYVVSDTKRHKRDWIIGLVTVFLVVLVVSLLQNAISKSPIIFMKLAEDSVGEYDLYLTPQITADSTTYLLNWTQVNQTLTAAPLVTGSTPRWVILAKLSNSLNRSESTSTAVLAIDSEQEKKIDLGRGWHHPALGENEMHVSRSVLSSIGVKPNAGETVFLDISIGGVLQSSGVLDSGIISDYVFSQIGNFGNTSIQDMTLGELLDMIEGPLAAIGINATEFVEGIFGTALPPLNTTAQDYFNQQLANFTISKEYLVMDEITDPNGKYPKALGNVAMIESKYISNLIQETASNFNYTQLIDNLNTLLDALKPFLNSTQINTISQIINALQGVENVTNTFVENFQVNDYALSIVVMYKERFKTYMLGQSGLTQKMIDFTNQVSDILGYKYPATYTLPIYTALVPLYYIRLLLNQIFTFVVVVLIVLGGLLIYSLLLSNVEEKTYEYGMLRALGMKSYVLIELLVTQSFSFSIPGVGIGLLFSFIVFIPIGYYISDFALSPLDITMDGTAAILATVLGLVLPLIAIVGPIQRALSRTLRDALDIYHLVQSEVTVRIIKLEKLGLSPWQITGSITMIVMGFVVYYIIPYSFTFQNLDLFFTILILILLGMLLGLSLIAITLQPFLERLVVHILLWGEDRRTLTELVKKNLGAHSRRNIKTAVMFTTALAFIIFAGVSFSLQGVTIANSVRLLSGADIAVVAPTTSSSVSLNEEGIRGFLDAEMKKSDPLVLGYVFTTPPLTQSVDYITSTQLSNLAGYPQTRVLIYGVEITYLPDTYTYFYQPQEVSSQFSYSKVDNKPDVIKSLYTDAGKAQLPQEKNGINIPPDVTTSPAYYDVNNTESTEEAYKDYVDVIISEAMRLTASVDVNTPLRIKINFNLDSANSTSRVYLGKSRAMISQLPGFFFSSYRQTASSSPVLVSMDQYYRIMKETYEQGNNRDQPLPAVPPKGQLHVHLKSNLNVAEREIVLNGIRNFIDNDLIQIFDTKDVVGSTTSALDLLTLFFNVVAVIAVVLCFFVLWLSFTANVNENAWEFGVLRALGLNSFRVIRMYIYEALCIIITSIMTGSIIGLLVSITLTLQFLLFSEMAFVFAFPYALFFSVLGMSVLVAILGSYIPSKVVLNKPIAIALKNM